MKVKNNNTKFFKPRFSIFDLIISFGFILSLVLCLNHIFVLSTLPRASSDTVSPPPVTENNERVETPSIGPIGGGGYIGIPGSGVQIISPGEIYLVESEQPVFHSEECSEITKETHTAKVMSTYSELKGKGYLPCGECFEDNLLEEH